MFDLNTQPMLRDDTSPVDTATGILAGSAGKDNGP
jgi:hypothetical protein